MIGVYSIFYIIIAFQRAVLYNQVNYFTENMLTASVDYSVFL